MMISRLQSAGTEVTAILTGLCRMALLLHAQQMKNLIKLESTAQQTGRPGDGLLFLQRNSIAYTKLEAFDSCVHDRPCDRVESPQCQR